MSAPLIQFVREQYRTNGPIPLHAPSFPGRESDYVAETIRSTFVSSVGSFVDRFETDVATYAGVERAVAVVNGTAALHIALLLAGVCECDLVLTQALTFVASCNAISYCGAKPVFMDVDRSTLGLSPTAAETWLHANAFIDDDGVCRTREDGLCIRACLPMHTFGHPVKLDELCEVCDRWNIALVEDAAEGVGSLYKGRHVGSIGRLGALSFNGNKIITTGGGGMILTDETLGMRAKHITTTAKVAHPYHFVHDDIGFNYRMPNLNAALGCGQLESLDSFVEAKRSLAQRYIDFLAGTPLDVVVEPEGCRSNYWLNAVICRDRDERDALLGETNDAGIMTRPIWTPMSKLRMYEFCLRDALPVTEWLENRIVNLPSSVPPA